jgi:16S rRNA G966 N2-methylase RsmD
MDNFKLNMHLLENIKYDYIEGDFFKVACKLKRSADIIFIDPPYGKYNCQNILDVIAMYELIKYNGIIIYEESKKSVICIDENKFIIKKEKLYGDTRIYIIEVKNGNIISRDL